MEVEALLERVLERVRPSKEEREKLLALAEEVKKKLSPYLEGVELQLMGSLAKDTFLRGKGDIDLFAIFPEEVPLEEAVARLFSAVERAFGAFEKAYAQHPYARFHYKGVKVEVIPSYPYRGGKPKTAVDRTQWHLRYVKENLREEQKDEVRLLKAFLQNLGLYGAEIKVEGFSGYLCELLIIRYGSFLSLLKRASRWKLPKVVEPTDPLPQPLPPIVFADPVDSSRNVAAPVSWRSASLFIAYSKAFLSSPSEDFFFLSGREELKGWKALLFPSPSVVEDVKWGQLKRLARAFRGFAESKGFSLFYHLGDDGTSSAVVFLLYPEALPPEEVREGPKAYVFPNLQRFLAGAKAWWVDERGVSEALKDRRIRTLEELVEAFLKGTSLPSHYRGRPRLVEWEDLPEKIKEEVGRDRRRLSLLTRPGRQ